MAVVIETTLGDLTVDLYVERRPRACINFLKLCKLKYYNFNLFHTVSRGFIAQTGDPTGSGSGGESVWGVLDGPDKRYFVTEDTPRIRHQSTGLLSMVGDGSRMAGSQFFVTLAPDLTYLDAQHCVFGEVAEGFDVLQRINETICDGQHRPYQDVRVTHTVVLHDPFPDPAGLRVPAASPEPSERRLRGGRIAPDEPVDETAGRPARELAELAAQREARARATILEMVGDIPDADVAPPENVLFVCKLNPVTADDDLHIIFSRFGRIRSCEVIRDRRSGDSLQYAFVEFADKRACEDAYFKMDNVLIDDRRIHVDFSQSVARVRWHGKGRGVSHYDDRGRRVEGDARNDLGNGRYAAAARRDPRPTERPAEPRRTTWRDHERRRSRSPPPRKEPPEPRRRHDAGKHAKKAKKKSKSSRRRRSHSSDSSDHRSKSSRRKRSRRRSGSRSSGSPSPGRRPKRA